MNESRFIVWFIFLRHSVIITHTIRQLEGSLSIIFSRIHICAAINEKFYYFIMTWKEKWQRFDPLFLNIITIFFRFTITNRLVESSFFVVFFSIYICTVINEKFDHFTFTWTEILKKFWFVVWICIVICFNLPLRAASWRAVSSLYFLEFTSAPLSMRSFAVSSLPEKRNERVLILLLFLS